MSALPAEPHPPGEEPARAVTARLTVEVDRRLLDYAERQVRAGKAPSVDAVVAGALADREQADREALARLREVAAHADQAKVGRMRAHVEAQLADAPERFRR